MADSRDSRRAERVPSTAPSRRPHAGGNLWKTSGLIIAALLATGGLLWTGCGPKCPPPPECPNSPGKALLCAWMRTAELSAARRENRCGDYGFIRNFEGPWLLT